MPPASWTEKILPWFSERMALGPLLKPLLQKKVPLHRHTAWYFLGGAALFLVGLQVVSGALLMLYYQPTAAQAYKSVRLITQEVPYGWLIRSVHHWSSHFLIALALLHLSSVFFLKAYRRPRELTWVTGTLALFVLGALGFSGYLLPWDERAFFATKVGTRIAGSLPLVGGLLLKGLRGGEEVTEATLTRFFAAHVVILPLTLAAILGIHLLLVQTQGMSRPWSVERRRERGEEVPFWPDFLLLDLAVWTGLFLGIVTLSMLWPRGLAWEANPLKPTPAGIRPEWYFLFLFETLKRLPAHVLKWEGEVVGTIAFGLAGLVVLLVPFLDPGAAVGRPSRLVTIAGLLGLGYAVGATFLSLATAPFPTSPTAPAPPSARPADWLGLLWLWGLGMGLMGTLVLKYRHQTWLRKIGFSGKEEPR